MTYRKIISHTAFAGVAALALWPLPAQADTLRDALRKAYDTNPTLAAAREGQKVTNEQVPLAKANRLPQASMQPSLTENIINDSTGNVSQARSFGVTTQISVPLYQGGGFKHALAAAENRVEAGFAGLRGTESELFSRVVGAYMDVIRDEAIVDLNRSQVGVLQVNLEATRDRFEIGDVTRTDVAQSEARLALAMGQMESARANLIRAKEIYIQLVGSPPGDLAPPPPLPNLPVDPDTAVDVAVNSNPDIHAAKQNREAAYSDRRAANAERLPTVSAIGRSQYSNALGSIESSTPGFTSDNDSFSTQVGLQANIPIFQGGRPSAQIRQAQARYGQAQEIEIATERDVIAQTRASYSSWRASLEVIDMTERAVLANELSLEGVRAENSVGNRTILDILNAEQELLNSRVQLVTARRNAYVAGFTLLAAIGKAEARDLGLEGGPLFDPMVDYERVKDQWWEWKDNPDPTTNGTRTIDTPAQKAEIQPLPNAGRLDYKR